MTVTDADAMEFENLLSSGPVFRQLYGDEGNLRIQKRNIYGDSFLLQPSARASGDLYGCVQYFKLYNSNTPFEDDRWAVSYTHLDVYKRQLSCVAQRVSGLPSTALSPE